MNRLLVTILLSCLNFIGWGQYGLERLPSPVNTDLYDEICPVMSYDEEVLFFTRSGSPDFCRVLRLEGKDLNKELSAAEYAEKLAYIYTQIAGKTIEDPIKSDFNQDVWSATIEDMEVSHPGHPLNNGYPNSICSNYSTRNEYVIINEFPVDGGVYAGFSYTRQKPSGYFTIPIPIKIQGFHEKGSAVNLSMSNDGQQIFISMTGPDSYGDQDLFLSYKIRNNLYSRPIHLGRTINTPYRESTPFISQDKNRLYFSSNRPGGVGGMDLYYCEKLDNTYQQWSEPVLIGQPINSPADESYPYVFLDENTIYFSTNRETSSDIYRAKLYRDDALDRPFGITLNIRNEEGKLTQGELLWKQSYVDKREGFFRTNTGNYRYILDENVPMEFYARKRSLQSKVRKVDPQVYKDQGIYEVIIDLYLGEGDSKIQVVPAQEATTVTKNKKEPIEDLLPLDENRTIILKNLYFERSKPDLLEISYPSLRQLAEVLKKRDHIQIRIEGHTDNVGNKKDLMDLSWDRAEAVKKFLISQGVMPENILTRGFGDSKPLNNNATEKARKENRRVEIRILKQ